MFIFGNAKSRSSYIRYGLVSIFLGARCFFSIKVRRTTKKDRPFWVVFSAFAIENLS